MAPQPLPTMKQMTADVWASLTDAQKLAIMELALLQLEAGAARAQIRHGEYWSTYHPGNATTLRAEVQRLRMIVGGRRPITINPPSVPIGVAYPPKNSTGWWTR